MSDIINKLTGRTFRQIDNTLAEILVDLGLVDYFRPAQVQAGAPQASRPKANTFTIGTNMYGKVMLTLTTPTGAVMHFSGSPADARDAFKSLAWNAKEQRQTLQGPEPSKEIIQDYINAKFIESTTRAATNDKLEEARNTTPGMAPR